MILSLREEREGSAEVSEENKAASRRFYDTVLTTLGYRMLLDVGPAIGYGVDHPVFWIGAATDRIPNRQSHLAFAAPSREAVIAFHDAALAFGTASLHPPRVWPEYHAGYFGAFVRDPDGNNVEAVHQTFG